MASGVLLAICHPPVGAGGVAFVALDKDIVLDALALRHRHYLSHWDAAVLCAAQRLGAHTVISEDMEHGRDYGGVTVINPFLPAPHTAAGAD